jgi:uncharacterized protein (TIGR00251 family)
MSGGSHRSGAGAKGSGDEGDCTELGWARPTDRGWSISVHVQPSARRSRVIGIHDGALRVQIAAPPVDGRANDELVRLLARLLEVPPTSIRLAAGPRGRRKRVEIPAGADPRRLAPPPTSS